MLGLYSTACTAAAFPLRTDSYAAAPTATACTSSRRLTPSLRSCDDFGWEVISAPYLGVVSEARTLTK